MMGRLKRDQGQFFYSFCLDEVVPDDHRVREIATRLALAWATQRLCDLEFDDATALAERAERLLVEAKRQYKRQ